MTSGAGEGMPAAPDHLSARIRRLGDVVLLATVVPLVLLGALLPYVSIRWSSEHLPKPMYAGVVVFAAVALAFALLTVSTKAQRDKWFPRLFAAPDGPHRPLGVALFALMVIITAAAVFASITFLLFSHNVVELESSLDGGITEGRLIDFYMWHLLDAIPVASVPKTARLVEPATYSGTWVGLLVLTFQVLVVAPIITTLVYSWKYRALQREARPDNVEAVHESRT